MPNSYNGGPTLSDLLGQANNYSSELEARNAAEQQRNMDMAKQIVDDNAKAGRSVNARVGDVDISQKEESPLKYLMQSQQRGGKALSHAYDTYMKAFPDVQKRGQAVSEGLEAINDPQQIGSIGQAKTLMIKNLGMNRYNQQEGNALVPNTAASVIHQIFNTVGAETNPLSDTQRQALNSVFQNSLQLTKKQHEMAKKNALGSYMNSGAYDPAQGEQFKSQVGADFDKQLGEVEEKYKKVPVTQGYQPNAQQQPGMIDRLKSMFTGSPQPQQSASPQGQAPMSFEEFKAKKRAGAL